MSNAIKILLIENNLFFSIFSRYFVNISLKNSEITMRGKEITKIIIHPTLFLGSKPKENIYNGSKSKNSYVKQ